MPKVNLPEILDLEAWWLTQIDGPVELSEWYQAAYKRRGEAVAPMRDCGTVFCLAGRYAEKCGAEWIGQSLLATEEEKTLEMADYDRVSGEWVTEPWTRAVIGLGLDGDEAENLFSPYLTVAQIHTGFARVKRRAEAEA
jgi:hypothetical protein